MSILITICARGGSKGIPRKNLRSLAGSPLIAYSIRCAHKFAANFDNVVVALSSEDSEIIQVAQEFGLQTSYLRPDHLASDTAGKVDVIADLLRHEESLKGERFETILDLDVTSPLRSVGDLQAGLDVLRSDPEIRTLFSVSPANRNPYFNMVEKAESGYYQLVKDLETKHLTRQAAPEVYDLNASFYFYRRRFFDEGLSSVITPFTQIYLMEHRCFDIDHEDDFVFMEYLIEQGKLNFDLI